eukprot:6169233-Prymnesium_polylepis.1
MGYIQPIKIDEFDNVADDLTKPVSRETFRRHLHYTHNFEGDPPLRTKDGVTLCVVPLAEVRLWYERLNEPLGPEAASISDASAIIFEMG